MITIGKYRRLSLIVVAALVVLAVLISYPQAEESSESLLPGPSGLTTSSQTQPLSYSPILSWDKDNEAIYYEIEFFATIPTELSDCDNSSEAIFTSRQIYQNHYNPPLQQFAIDYLGKSPLYWRVRGINFDGEPYTKFSDLQALWTNETVPLTTAPQLLANYGDANGSVLLYPVYHWVPLNFASSYEIALYETNPDGDAQLPPVAQIFSPTAERYDSEPRLNDRGYFWRVRGLDANGKPVGDWSTANYFRNVPADNWEVAVLGDSISHGGGHFSYGPEDLEFSWLSYLDFPTINLSESGDTVQMTLARFERDVLPFKPKYLLIMTGSNSLRAGEDPMVVIECLQQIQTKALQAGIMPIFLTLPPINPVNIQHIFAEGTTPDWKKRFAIVNQYIKTQVHIDVASVFKSTNGLLPTVYALDGLHPDANGKKLMGEYINKEWAAARQQALKKYQIKND